MEISSNTSQLSMPSTYLEDSFKFTNSPPPTRGSQKKTLRLQHKYKATTKHTKDRETKEYLATSLSPKEV